MRVLRSTISIAQILIAHNKSTDPADNTLTKLKEYLMKRILSPLLALSLLVGCGQGPQAPFDARLNLKNNVTAALSNIADHGESIKAMQAAVHAALESLSQESGAVAELEQVIKSGLSQLIPSRDMVNAIVDNALESPLAHAIFNEQNVVASTNNSVTYRLKPTTCKAVSTLVGPEGDEGSQMLGAICEVFLSKNNLDLSVTLTGEKSIDLKLVFNGQFVVSVAVGENGIGTQFNLDGLKLFVESLMKAVGNPAIPLGPVFFQGFQTLTGELSFGLQFASKDKASPCKNGEKICFVANVDKDFALVLKGQDKFDLKIGRSPADKPTLTVSAPHDGDFAGAFNIGVIEGNFSSRHSNDQLFIDALSFNVRVPKTEYPAPTVVLFDNIKTGPRASFAEFDKQRITVKLTNEGGQIATIKAVNLFDSESPVLTVSPLSLTVTHTDEQEKDCKIVQKFVIKADAASTTATFGDSRDQHRQSKPKGCTLQGSEAYNFFKGATVKSDPEICSKGHLQVSEGKLVLQYSGQVNNESEQSMTHTVDNGQCLGY